MFGIMPYEKKFFDPFFGDFDKAFNSSALPGFKTDVKDTGDSYIIESELPGFKKEDIKIDINGDVMTISAENTRTAEEKDENGSYIRRERTFGSVARTFDISDIRSEDISASYNDGVLTLNLPKKTATEPEVRRLEIR
ncbi:MAG: Hsp20/alpha crystallin family protein [Oscillospiraceae bacterium]